MVKGLIFFLSMERLAARYASIHIRKIHDLKHKLAVQEGLCATISKNLVQHRDSLQEALTSSAPSTFRGIPLEAITLDKNGRILRIAYTGRFFLELEASSNILVLYCKEPAAPLDSIPERCDPPLALEERELFSHLLPFFVPSYRSPERTAILD